MVRVQAWRSGFGWGAGVCLGNSLYLWRLDMAGTNMVEQVRDGMQVRVADGRWIGNVRQVYICEAAISM